MTGMTAYTSKKYRDSNLTIEIEMRVLNNKYFDYSLNIPPILAQYENEMRKIAEDLLVRGSFALITTVTLHNPRIIISLDEKRLLAYKEGLTKIADICGINEEISLQHFSGEDFLTFETEESSGTLWSVYRPFFIECIGDLQRQRKIEGENTFKDIEAFAGKLENAVKKIERMIPEADASYSEKMYAHISQMFNDKIDEERILAEVAALMIRFNINEEIVRLKSHIEYFIVEMQKEGEVGKHLDFLCQEISREANTLLAKAVDMNLKREALSIKEITEKVREQLRNVV